MIAYNTNWLDNLAIRRETEKAFDKGCITSEENVSVLQQYPVGFYMPNPYVRIGLFILTAVIAFFSFGLFSLMFLSSSETGWGLLCIFFGIVSYGVLETMVHSKNHYKSGVDDALMWMSGAFIIGGMNIISNLQPLTNAILIFIIAGILTIRFANAIMAAATFLSLLAVIFLAYIKIGPIAKATTPFLLMIITAIIYFSLRKELSSGKWKYYSSCITIVIITALICFFAAGNYFVVRETSNSMFELNLREGESIPYGWLFWILTAAVPLVYIYRGLQIKDRILLRVGVLLVAAIVFTYRYYYHVIPVEMAMTIGGIILIFLSYALIKYLDQPKNGFTSHDTGDKHVTDALQVEALAISETYSAPSVAPSNDNNLFGGGSGGGGGASGEY